MCLTCLIEDYGIDAEDVVEYGPDDESSAEVGDLGPNIGYHKPPKRELV